MFTYADNRKPYNRIKFGGGLGQYGHGRTVADKENRVVFIPQDATLLRAAADEINQKRGTV